MCGDEGASRGFALKSSRVLGSDSRNKILTYKKHGSGVAVGVSLTKTEASELTREEEYQQGAVCLIREQRS